MIMLPWISKKLNIYNVGKYFKHLAIYMNFLLSDRGASKAQGSGRLTKFQGFKYLLFYRKLADP